MKALPARLLVARLDNAGDVLLSGPAVRAAAAAGPVTYLAGPAGAEAARLLPGVSEVLTFDAPWVGYQPPAVDGSAVGDLVDRIRAVAADAALVLTSFHQSPLPLALLLRLAGIGRIAAICEDYPGSLLDERVPDDPTRHEVEQGLAVAAALGLALPTGDDGRLAVTLPGRDPDLDRSAGSPYVVVHPGASVPARALPFGLAAAAVAALAERGWDVTVTGSRGEADLVAQVAGPAATGGRGLAGRVHAVAGAVDLAGHVHLRALVEDGLRIVKKQDETLRAHRHLRPLELRRDSHRTGRLRVLVWNHAAIFEGRRRHDQWRRLGPASTGRLSAACGTTLRRLRDCRSPTHRRKRHHRQKP